MNLTNTSFTLSSSWTHQCNHTTTESVCDDGSTITRHPNLPCRKQAITIPLLLILVEHALPAAATEATPGHHGNKDEWTSYKPRHAQQLQDKYHPK